MFHKFLKMDLTLIISVAILIGISLTVLYSISAFSPTEAGMSVFWKQLIYVGIGSIVFLIVSLTNYNYFKINSTSIYFLTLLVLLLVLIFGKTIRGTSGWIVLGPFHIQPVEVSKLALIIFLSSFISQKKMELEEAGRVIASLVLSGVMIFLVLKQPDFGSAMVLTGIWAGMLLMSGISRKVVISMVLAFVVIVTGGWYKLADYQKARIMTVLEPSKDPRGSGYNVLQSTIAVGSGGLIGKGIGHGSQSQLNFLPEKHTDFIFAAIAEELGLLGSVFVICLFILIFYRIKKIAMSAPDNFGYLVAIGILLMLFVQVFENIGMNIGIMPVTGIPLPMVSYGGSSLIISMAAIGILCNIYSRREAIIHTEEF